VLDFASFESGRVRLFPAVVPVRDLAEACIGLVGPMAVERGLKLRVVQSHDVPRQIVADPSRLRQVLVNLLGNAIKYTDAGSVELRLSAGGSPGGLRVEIADTGRGINEASRDLTTPLISFRPDLAPIRTDFLPDRGYFVDECASWGRKRRTCAVADG
jgi:signal transduction histidine kinase